MRMLDVAFDRGDIAFLYKCSLPLFRFNPTDLAPKNHPPTHLALCTPKSSIQMWCMSSKGNKQLNKGSGPDDGLDAVTTSVALPRHQRS